MKAIIVEIQGKYAAALSDDGVVSKIKNRNFCLGQEIVIRNNSNNLIKVVASAAAAIIIFVTPAWAYLTPYSYVSLDVNPSFEFSVNRFDRVLTVKAVNDDGEEFVKNVDVEGLKNKEIQNAIKNILKELENQGYIIDGEESGVIVATYSKTQDKTDMLAEKLRNTVNEQTGEQQENTEANTKEKPEKPEKIKKPEKTQETEIDDTEAVEEIEEIEEIEDNEKKPEKQEKPEKKEKSKNQNIQVIEVTEDEVDEAKKLKVTPGKKNLVDKLSVAAESAKEEISKEEWLKKSVQEINAKIKEYREQEKQTENINGNGSGNNNNQDSHNGNGNGNKKN